MTHTNVSSLQRTMIETQTWLKELAESSEFRDEEQAYTALRASLHALRDRLTVEEAAHLAAQLPMLVRGFYYEGWRPAEAPNVERSAEEFIAHVEWSLRNAAAVLDPERTVRAVFEFLENKLDEGQIEQVKGLLPKEIQSLWPTPARLQQ